MVNLALLFVMSPSSSYSVLEKFASEIDCSPLVVGTKSVKFTKDHTWSYQLNNSNNLTLTLPFHRSHVC